MSRLTWVAVADIHFNNNDPYGKTTDASVNSRVSDRAEFLAEAVAHAVEKKVDLFVVLGDIYNTARPVDRIRRLFYETLAPLFEANIPVYVILGNHDMAAFDHGFNLDSFFMGTKESNVQIISEPVVYLIHGIPVAFVPWTRNDFSFMSKISTAEIVFAHVEFIGARMNMQTIGNTGVSADEFSGKVVRSGHYHLRQELKEGIGYVGGLARQNFGEAEYSPGYEYGEMRKLDFDQGLKLTLTWKPVDEREFRVINYKLEEPLIVQAFNPTDIIRVVIQGTRAKLRAFSMSNEIVTLRQAYEKAFYYDEVFEPVNGSEKAAGLFSADEIMDSVFGERVAEAKAFLDTVEE